MKGCSVMDAALVDVTRNDILKPTVQSCILLRLERMGDTQCHTSFFITNLFTIKIGIQRRAFG